ncbi:MAG: segregation/condensation protein A [Pseudomonadaceae bacterium]|nr:segregation/condensation protein A [Pseudomonadaceae bacterium]
MVQGEAVTELPKDLYIPPDALRVFLETFSGPLDLLLYLIRRQNLDILEIKVAEITRQYMQYIELMSALQLELAGEYLVMAAMLAEIKSRMLLPKPVSDDEDDTDPRAELVRRLQEYEQFKTAGENVEAMPRMERDIFPIAIEPPDLVSERPQPTVELKELLVAFAEVLHRADMFARHAIHMEPLSVRERMTQLLSKLKHSTDFVPFADFFTVEEGRSGVVVSFLAMMELVREGLVDIVQNEAFAPIYLRASSEERTQKFGLYSAEDGGDQALVEAADESAFEEADATEADDSALAEKASATGAADSSLQDEQPDGASESKTD